jgi:hypothetical protein
VERLLREKPIVNGLDLVRQWPNGRRLDGRERIEDVSEFDPPGFRGETKRRTVRVEGPTASRDLNDSLQITVGDEAVSDGAVI